MAYYVNIRCNVPHLPFRTIAALSEIHASSSIPNMEGLIVDIDAIQLFRLLSLVRGQLQSDANRSIRKRDISEGLTLIGGMDALDTFKRRLESQFRVFESDGEVRLLPPVVLHRGGEPKKRKAS